MQVYHRRLQAVGSKSNSESRFTTDSKSNFLGSVLFPKGDHTVNRL